MVISREQRFLRLALAWNAGALLCISALMGGWMKQLVADTLPPYGEHVLVTGGRRPGEPTLTPEDVDYLLHLSGVKGLHPRDTRRDTAHLHIAPVGADAAVTVHATSLDWPRLAGFRVLQGRMWSYGELQAGAPVALLSGAWTALPAFVTLRNETFRVIGVLEGPAGLSGPERAVWTPLPAWRALEAKSFLIEIERREDLDSRVAADLDRWMRDHHGVAASGQGPVTITTFGRARSEIRTARKALYVALIAFFALPSIFVGSGVAAVTRLSIHQRIPEIGLRRAVGATRQEVLDLFVGEALTLALGATWRAIMIAVFVLSLGSAAGIALHPPVPMVLLALLLPSMVCFAFSVPPAVAAAELAPATALGVR